MERVLITSGSAFEEAIGYSRAVVVGDFVFVSGCTGYDYETNEISPDIVQQAEQSLMNVASALKEAGSGIEDVVRVQYTLVNRSEFERVWPVLRKWFGGVRPAATMVVAGLMREEMRIEVEVTAVRGSGGIGGM
ncbi:endoribonuclease L-PSP [Xylariaceae sp. FL1272]|nr:endoribonuclease L-PSP [Xylariaceae sp. FL1272]